MASERDVSDFWGHGNTLERILGELKKAGLSLDSLTVQDLAPADLPDT